MAELVFVCWGNICRSPMAEVLARDWARDHGIDAVVASAAVSREEEGRPMDRRAQQVLREAGHDVARGRAATLIDDAIFGSARLVVAAEQHHVARMAPLAERHREVSVRLVTDFIPGATPGSPLDDPWYGDVTDFRETLGLLEAAMPQIFAELERLRQR
ncbi:low molecular weight protein-tyrosine-phosphatase [Aestuariimicrobium soli]|uniref:arsenate reductase/protein-tyrosine-phosphatase family protein n=1 Tax=Aestuariimicrobium soli TaxID=2035834 RepID=UPI003EBD16BB